MNYEEKYNEILEWARKNKARLNGVPFEEELSKMMVHKAPYLAPVPTPMIADEQKPAEWNKEDEMYLSQAIETLEHENYLILADKLKSLKPQTHWKPSEEQMKALHRCIYYLRSNDSEYFEPIKSLYEQLKKL